jgi:GT2 family glycosyltransferase
MTNSKVSIIVLNYNGLIFLKKCFLAIKKQTYSDLEILMVDNNSTDGSCDFIKEFPEVRVIKNDCNYGYSKANNIAAKKAKGEFLLFLNNDTEIFPNMLEKLVLAYEDKSILTPAQILGINKEFDSVGASGNGADIFGYPYGDKDPKKTKCFYADGAAFFVKKEDFIDIGMFDEELFIFQEDLDFSWRAQLLGYHIKPIWDAQFYHYSGGTVLGGASKGKKYESSYFRRYLNEKNVIRNILKNYSLLFCLIILPALLVVHLFEIIILLFMFKYELIREYINAYKWNIINIKNTLNYRKMVQGRRILSDWTIIKKMYFAYSKLTAFSRVGMPNFQ